MENSQNSVQKDTAPSIGQAARAERAAQSEGLHFIELLQIIKLRRKLLFFFIFVTILGIAVRQILYVPLFYSQTSLSVQKIENSPMQMALANLGTMPIDTTDRLKKYTDYMQSNDFFLAVAETLKFQEGYGLLNLNPPAELSLTTKKFWVQFFQNNFGRSQLPRADLPEPVLIPVEQLATLLRAVTTTEAIGTDNIRIKVTTLDPFTSMVLANTETEVFVKKTSERDYNEVTEVKRFIEQQLDSTTERLKRSESALVDFKRHHNIISISAEHSSFASKLSTIENELESSKMKMQENLRLLSFYEKTLTKKEAKLLSSGSASLNSSQSDQIFRLRRQLESLQQRKSLMMAQGFSESAWQMKELDRDIDQSIKNLKEKLGPNGSEPTPQQPEDSQLSPDQIRTKLANLSNENKGLEAKVSTIEKSKDHLLKSLETLPKEEQVLLTLTKDLDLQFELYSLLKKKLQEVEIQQVALQSRVLVNERAATGAPTARTNFLMKILFGLLVSSFFGCSIAFFLEAIDPTVKHLADLEKMEITTLGSIPRIYASEIRQSLGARSYRPDLLVTKDKPESGEAMAFKYLRAQIARMRAPDGTPAKVLAFTSPERGDGKSLTCSNLAVSLSQLEKKVLLVDCDFRNPSIPWYFGYKEGNGLTSLLTLKASLEEVILKERHPGLDILPAGWALPNPSELISGDKFRLLLDHLRSRYDYILIDAPPAIAVVDASVIANLSDGMILVAGFRKTKKHLVLMALRKILSISNKHVYGLLNGVGEIQEYENYASSASAPGSPIPSDSMDSKSELLKFAENLNSLRAG